MWGQYELYGATSNGAGIPSSSFASIANRVSYFFNFQGPSLALDTMCSSSLTAIHLASEEVRKGAIDVAIAGGVNVSIHPGKYLNLSQGNFASTDGRCRSFGEGGDGYVPGEGVGAVLLKPLAKAVRDGDQIYAVVKASSINHGGKTNGYTVPNPVAQADLILEALNNAKVNPGTIDYIETHGTGTSLGDPIEITGLVRAFEGAGSQGRSREKQFCAIGSVKSNIGHLESAAGIAAVTKVLLQLKHRQLVPSLHAERLNPLIAFADTPFYVQRSFEDWKRPEGRPRRAAVSSFGAGGSNAHLILEEFVDACTPVHRESRPEAFLLSAKNRETLFAYAQKTIEFLEEASELSLADVAFTSQVGRTPMQERLVIVASSMAALMDKLRQWLHESSAGPADKREQSKRSVAGAIEDVYEGSVRDAQSSVSALIEGDAGRAFLQLTFEQRDLAKLAKLWIAGMEIDWISLYGTQRPKRVSLPTYPFARERYWIDAPATLAALPAAHERKETLYYRTEWNPAQLIATEPERNADSPLLVLGADDELSASLERQTEGPVVAVKYGDGYRQLGTNVYCVDHRSEHDFNLLIETLTSRDAMPEAIVHIVDDSCEVREQLDRGVFALHGLCKAVMKQKPKGRVRIISLQKQGRAPHAALHRALHRSMPGYLKSLALENPKFAWKVVSVDGERGAEEIARCLSNELCDAGWEDSEVRYLNEQQGDRLVSHRQTRQMKRYAPPAIEKLGAAVKHNGVYIVTGGLGGLGYIFSEHLAREYGAKLVLTGRSALNAEQQTKLAALNTHGDTVIYVQADVSDPEQADAVVLAAKRRFSRISGVIHSAGIHRDSFALNKTREEMESVLAAKVMGTINLDRATQDEDIDLFVLFSSVAGALGNPGQCDYAFANNFLDAFAEQRQAWVSSGQRFGKTLSINWPFWESGGMRISQSDIDLMARRSGISPLPTEQAIRYWETFLQSKETQCIALYGDAAKIDAYLSRGISEATPSVRSEMRAANAQSLRKATENYLKTLLSEQIKLSAERIDSQERFDAFGVDSMMISRINADLERDLGDLPKTLFYEYATIEELAAYLMQEAQPALARRFVNHLPTSATIVTKDDAVSAQRAPIQRAPVQTLADESEKIAIIGMHGQFPRSESLAEYWRNLKEGRDLIEPVPDSRWDLHEFFDADPENAKHGKIYCKWGGFVDDFDKFDAAFFGITPEDARMIDPQERMFIQSVWAAVEDAGYTRDSLKKRYPKARSADVGVFVGVTSNTYHLLAPEERNRGNMVTPGSLPWSIANRVSYFFDFQGPSMPVDTACSSSLVAIHLACESLKRKECQVAVAGGVNLYLHPSKYQSLCRRRMLAVDGKCRSFGDGGDGFIPSEGVGTVVLKPMARAIEDGDHIYGVVAASACEHSGRSNGYSAPNPNSQAMLIERTLAKAGIDPESIGYVEGHGTGTQLGDSLEVASLTQAFRKRTQKKRYCPLGSVKANAGHSESAAGIAGVAKIMLQFEHQQIAPTIHCEKVNPNIEFDNSPFYLQRELTPWSAPAEHPRRAMINSFGAGGVNSCLVLEDYEPPEGDGVAARTGSYLVVLSAKNERRLRESATRLRDHLKAQRNVDLDRLAYTLQVGREAMDERLAVVVSSVDELLSELSAYVAGTASSKLAVGRVEPHRKKKLAKQEEREREKSLFERGELDALAQMWVEGCGIEWDVLYIDRPYRLPLPTYPFAKERYWVSDSPVPKKPVLEKQIAVEPKTAKLHPLVSRNVSTLKEVCFSSSLSVKEYYARDHQVNGESFFPGAGFLEIACVNGTIAGEASVTRIKDILWIQPLRLTTEDHLVKTFLMSNGNETEYVIVSFNDDNERVVHSEGRLSYERQSKHGDEAQAPYSIEALKNRAEKNLSGSACYRQFEDFGFRYGPCFRTIQELHIGSDFALSRLDLTEELKGDFEQYILHPSIIDGALQTAIGIATGGEPNTPHLPFAVDEVEILQPLTETCYVYVEHAVSENPVNSEIKQFNIRLLGENGDVRVKLNNFYVRALRNTPALEGDEADGLLLTE
ncbi:MAG: type I polyketide synthase [Steroidobacteraceae bacterium]